MRNSREFPDSPILAVGAVVLHTDCVLLVQRARAPLAGQWALPGGIVELGETLAEAIVRELQEETGLIVRPVSVLDCLDKIERLPEGRIQYHYVLVEFLCEVLSGTLQPSSDADQAQWFELQQLKKNPLGLSETSLHLIAVGSEKLKALAE